MSSHIDRLDLEISVQEDCCRARFLHTDSLNEYNADRVGHLLTQLGEKHPNRHVLLDLNSIQYVTSTILGHFMALNRKLRSAGGHLSLENPSQAVVDVLHATSLDQVLELRVPGKPD